MKQAIWIPKFSSNQLTLTACWINHLFTQNMSFEVFWNPKSSDFIVTVPNCLILMKHVLFFLQRSGADITHGDSYALLKARSWGKSTQGKPWRPLGWFQILIIMIMISFQNRVVPSIVPPAVMLMKGISLSVILISLFTSSARNSTVTRWMWYI